MQSARSSAERCGWPRPPPASFRLPLEDALQLVRLCAEKESPRYEKAAMRWPERYLAEGSPRLQHLAESAASLAKLEHE